MNYFRMHVIGFIRKRLDNNGNLCSVQPDIDQLNLFDYVHILNAKGIVIAAPHILNS